LIHDPLKETLPRGRQDCDLARLEILFAFLTAGLTLLGGCGLLLVTSCSSSRMSSIAGQSERSHSSLFARRTSLAAPLQRWGETLLSQVNFIAKNLESLNGDSQVSGSTSVILNHGGSPPPQWSVFQTVVLSGRAGGRQAVSEGVYQHFPKGRRLTTWSDGVSGSTKLSQSIISTEQMSTNGALSVHEDMPITAVLSEVMWSTNVGNGISIQQPVSFARNLTNNP
jgi:hypothetical protein